MRTIEQLENELDDLIRRNYYAEDFELRWTLQKFGDELPVEDRAYFHQLVLQRLTADPSIMTVMLCSASLVPEAVPILVSVLNDQPEANMLTRSILSTLGRYGEPSAFDAVERFLDSDQEPEALTCLARLSFARALFYVLRASKRKHLHDVCLQILHERRKQSGLIRLITELSTFDKQSRHNVPRRVKAILRCKDDPYNPFTPEEIDAVLQGL
jgi:hypothetical protein